MSEAWTEIDAYLKARGVRIGPPTREQTTGGKHVPTSYHYRGTARDYGVHDSDATAVARALKPLACQANSPIAELFFAPLNVWYKHGYSIPGFHVGGHQDHCHVALEVNRHLFSARTVHMGSTGPDVRVLQMKLTKAGYHLVPDGVMGPKTVAAIKAFQAKKGLAVDGVVGVKTWAALG